MTRTRLSSSRSESRPLQVTVIEKSWKNTDPPELVKCLKHLREGDTLVI